jgi:hypothetical protein
MDAAESRNRALIKAIEDHGREIRDLRRSVENAFKKDAPPAQVTTQIFEAPPQPAHPIHLAFMNPNDPRPTCWPGSGLGGKFTITSHPEDVTCEKCKKIMEDNE